METVRYREASPFESENLAILSNFHSRAITSKCFEIRCMLVLLTKTGIKHIRSYLSNCWVLVKCGREGTIGLLSGHTRHKASGPADNGTYHTSVNDWHQVLILWGETLAGGASIYECEAVQLSRDLYTTQAFHSCTG